MKRRLTLHHPLSPARPHLTLGMTLLVTFVGTSAGTQPTDAPAPPTVTVRLSNGREVTVTGPAATPHPDDGWVGWFLEQKRASPDGRFVALMFLKEAVFPKDHLTTVFLARPDGTVLPLPDSDVNVLKWTPDGQYLLGGGITTLRLWNTRGGVRRWTGGGMDVIDATTRFACLAEHDVEVDRARVVRLRLPLLKEAGEYVVNGRPKDGERFCR